MNIRVHLPTTAEGWELLDKRLSEVQSDLIINQINKLPCTYEERLLILEGVREKLVQKWKEVRKDGQG